MNAAPIGKPLLITSVFGTRPEAVKLLPLLRQLAQEPQVTSRVVLTGQHREMVDQILGPFAIIPDADLGIMRPRQGLNDIVARAMPALDELLEREQPDMVVVQGDTTSAFCAALAAFHRRIPVAHLEAGLRTHDRFHPYPEEVNRRMISAVADLHLAPTARAAAALKAERVPDAAVVVTGNTVIDALMMALAAPGPDPAIEGLGDPMLLVTLHRREAWDSPGHAGASVLDGILEAIARIARRHPELTIVYPVHLNPRVQEPAADRLGGLTNVKLVPPQPYLAFVKLMARAQVIVTDSGGIQEEAPSLGIPVLVVRQTTERPEGLASGSTRLVGTDPAVVENALESALAAPRVRPAALPAPSPFGDGQAAVRTAQAILHFLGRGPAPVPFQPLTANSGFSVPE